MSDEIKQTGAAAEKNVQSLAEKKKVLIDILDKGSLNLKQVGALANMLHNSDDGKCGCRDVCGCKDVCSPSSQNYLDDPDISEYRSAEILNAIKKALNGNKQNI